MNKTKKQETYYIDPSKFIDFKKPGAPMTFIVGARGVGKTVNVLAYMLKRCYQTNTKFIYLRRYDNEIETTRVDLNLQSKLVGYEVSRSSYIDENKVGSDMLWVEDKPIGYMMSLNSASKVKSNAFPDVEWIVYDEFIDPKGRELKNETLKFYSFAQTVFRDYDKYKAIFLANATNLYNNYFLDLEILPTGRVTNFRDKGIKVIMYETSSALRSKNEHSFLGKQLTIIEGETGSSLTNNFDNQFDDFIRKLNKDCKFLYSLKIRDEIYGVWTYQEDDQSCILVSNKTDPSKKEKFSLGVNYATEEFPVVTSEMFQILRSLFFQNKMFFTDVKARSRFIKILRHAMLLASEED